MIALGLIALLVQAPIASDSLQRLVETNDPRVPSIVRQYPDSARATLTHLLAVASRSPVPGGAHPHLATAGRLALAYATAFSDSFEVRQVRRFERWTPAERTQKVRADSLRGAGADAFATSGAEAAMAPWRESLRLARAIADSAGEAAASGNLGAGFYREHALDSAERYLLRARSVAERIGDYRTLANALVNLASISKDRGALLSARSLYSRALALRPRSGDDRGAAADENNLGLIAQELGDTAGARTAYALALERNRRAARFSIAAVNLTNLANLATAEGSYTRASTLYREALATYRGAKARASAAPVLHNLGLLEMRRGDFGAAHDALAEAAAIFESTGPESDAIAVRADLAQADGAMGDLQSAVSNLRRAESAATRSSRPELAAKVALTRGDLAMDFNALGEAERDYTTAARLFGELHDDAGSADAQQGLGSLLLRRNDVVAARRTFEQVRSARAVAHDRHGLALAQLLLGHALGALGDTASARRELSDAVTRLRRLGDAAGEATALGALGYLDLDVGRLVKARATFTRALARLGTRDLPGVSAELHYGRARTMVAHHDLDAAALELRRALDGIERVAGRIRLSERRAGFREDKWEMYAQLALVERERGNARAAFDVSERLRARQMLDLLAAGRVPSGVEPADSLVVLEQDLRRRIAELERALEQESRGHVQLRGPAFRQGYAGARREELDAAQRSYQNVLLRLHEKASGFGQLIHPTTATAAAVAQRLRPDEAMLEYLVSDSTTLVFVVRNGDVKAIDLGVGRRSLASAVDFTRETISHASHVGRQELWRAPLRRLYNQLIDPVDRTGALLGVRTLLIAPHAELHYLPFSALISGGAPDRFLVERFDIAYVPSASAWLALVGRHSDARSTGLLAFAPRPDMLPASADEVAALKRLYGSGATVLTGREATESAFRERASRFAVLHLATFGVLNKHNPLFSHLVLNADAQHDGRLNVHELFGVPLHARLVVLSACQTALGSGALADVPAGDDWIGLVRAFLFAGADNVVATLWPVRDRPAARVMTSFYREMAAGQSLPTALALAQRHALHDPRTSDPVHWSAFTLVGGTR